MDRRQFLTIVAGQVLLAACAGSTRTASPASNTSSSTTTTPLPSTSTVPVVTTTTLPPPEIASGLVRKIESPKSPAYIQYDAGVPDFWLQMLADAIAVGQTELGDSGPLVVHSYSSADTFVPPYAKFLNISEDNLRGMLDSTRSSGGRGNVWQYLPNHLTPSPTSTRFPHPGQPGPSPPVNFLHEYFHTVQGWLITGGRFALIPAWLQEGSADYFSTRLGVDLGLETALTPGWQNPAQTFDQKRAGAVRVIRQSSQSLPDFEARPPDGISPTAYQFGNIATELLVQRYGRTKAIHDIYTTITPAKDWKMAFIEVFGLSIDQFYADFAEYRKTL